MLSRSLASFRRFQDITATMDDRARLLELEAENAELRAENAELRRRLAQVEHQLQHFLQRRKCTTGKRPPRAGTPADRRRQEHRRHPGSLRPEPPPGTVFTEHDVHPRQCPHRGSADLEATGTFEGHFVADLPEPKVE